jgi:sugar/nucleoside kinase (ribokinase family)
MVDVLCAELPPEGGRVHSEVVVRAGGTAVNSALAAADAGAAATVVGRVGSDPSGELISRSLEAGGITGKLARDSELSTGAAVALGTSVVAQRGANARLSLEDLPDPLEADTLLVSGFALFQRGSTEAARSALQRFSGRWSAVDFASSKLVDLELAAGAYAVLATAAEARAVTGAEPEEAAKTLASRFELAVVKLGKDGAIAVRGDLVERVAAEPVERRSAFGAGDAFAGALLVALARDDSLQRALQLACDAGARAAATSPWRDSPSPRTTSSQ